MPGRTKLRQGQTQTSKEEGGSTSRTTAQIEKYYSGGKRPFTYKKNDRGKVIKVELKGGGMSSGQAKIAAKAPPPNKIDAKDFAVLRQEKARGRGMGLQDEKVKPGKVMKAGLGLMFMKKAKDKGAQGAEFLSPVAMAKRMFNKKAGGVIKARVGRSVTRIPLAGKSTSVGSTTMKGMKFSDKAKMVDAGKINKATGKFTSMEALRESVGYRAGESTDKFNKRRMALAAAKKAVSASKIGKIALGIGTAGVAASQYLKSKMNKKNNKTLRDARLQKKPGIPSETTQKINKALSNIKTVKLKKDKKMGGGMMQRPMGYKTGGGHFDEKNQNVVKHIRFEVIKNKKNVKKKMGGGMMKPMGYSEGTPRGVERTPSRSNPVMGRPGGRRARKVQSGQGPLGGAGQAARGLGALGAAAARKKDDASILASYHKAKFYDGPTDTAKDTVHPMKAQRHFMDSKKYRQKKAAKKMYETGEDKAGNKTSNTKSAQYFRDMNSPETIKRAKEDFFKPFKEKRMYKSGGSVKGYRTGTMVKARGCKLGRTRPTKIT